MARQKKDTIVFKQTLSNAQYKELHSQSIKAGQNVQDTIRDLVKQHLKNQSK